ncbi:MAG: hypothetical protein RL215_3339 [Planctomycetota bacterium]
MFLGIDETGVERDAVFGAEFEDVSDFDAVDHFESAGAFGAGVSAFGIAEVERFCDGEVEAGDDAGEVSILFVGADDGGGDLSGIMIDEEWAFQSDGASETDGCAGDLKDGGFVSEFDGGAFGGAADFAFVGGMVTAEEDGEWFAVDLVDEGFDEGLWCGFQEFADLFDAAGVGSIDADWCGCTGRGRG